MTSGEQNTLANLKNALGRAQEDLRRVEIAEQDQASQRCKTNANGELTYALALLRLLED